MKVCVIGAGASGLFCAGQIQKFGHDVTVFDGNEKAGKKIYITGKGRCNFTNVCDNENFLQNIVRGKKFLYSAINNFSSYDTLSFFSDLGMEFVIERGNRAFPKSNKASDVTKTLLKNCDSVKFKFGEKVISVEKDNVFKVTTTKEKYIFDSVIVATGGKSYEATGSDGFGYEIAKKFGHSVIALKPALVPIEVKDDFVKDLQGLSLKNVSLNIETENKKLKEFGEMMFTDKGITGPIVLTLSSLINREFVKNMFIDFKPALSEEQLENRFLREFDENKNKDISNVMKNFLPQAIILPFLKKAGVESDKKCNNVSVLERKKLINTLKCFTLTFKSLYNLNVGVVTSGGVCLDEINPKTMESKLIKNLYFVGEVLDIDALTGGFNLQVAWTTANACSENFKEI